MEEPFRSENDIIETETHNFYIDDEIAQEGDTVILEFDTIVEWVLELVMYNTGMGRWCWIKMKGDNGNICRIFCAYQSF